MENNVFFDSQKYEWEEVAPGVKRQITGYNNDIMMVLVKFEKGAIGTAHSHPHTQSTYVESGEFEVQMGDKKQLLKKGDCFFAPPNIVHGVVCFAEGILVDVFSPVREDFL
ncbi:cupin domain-containing protein [Prolixibacteraceae bacterium Z1-6]|uniref:Cupin domain-containing protein n=1 Tax=Draconibacterium aestuarii TaxID=2998507 RepID=A0A9X3FEZ2_9BACT|nr:cupin domain-containing protein [Prolixibacteraceae bacterium Z1-6]